MLRRAFGQLVGDLKADEMKPDMGDYLRTLELHKAMGGQAGATNAKFTIRIGADFAGAQQGAPVAAFDPAQLPPMDSIAPALVPIINSPATWPKASRFLAILERSKSDVYEWLRPPPLPEYEVRFIEGGVSICFKGQVNKYQLGHATVGELFKHVRW